MNSCADPVINDADVRSAQLLMNKPILSLTIIASIAVATASCSKEEAVAPEPLPLEEATAPAPGTEAAAVPPVQVAAPAELGPQFQEDMTAASQSLNAGDYDRAITTLITMDQVPKSAAAEAAWRAYYYQQVEALRQKAEFDENARQAYQRMGRQMMGR